MTAPGTGRLRELADNYEYLAGIYRGDEAEESKRCADIAAALRAVISIRKAVGEITDGRHLSDAMDEIEAILGAPGDGAADDAGEAR